MIQQYSLRQSFSQKVKYDMIEIYECTDCKHCVSFGFGFRVACGCPDLPADEVYKYAPVDPRQKSAENCSGYNDGQCKEFPESDINKAVEMFGDDVLSLRKWAELKFGQVD
jgi:hypothetical protein